MFTFMAQMKCYKSCCYKIWRTSDGILQSGLIHCIANLLVLNKIDKCKMFFFLLHKIALHSFVLFMKAEPMKYVAFLVVHFWTFHHTNNVQSEPLISRKFRIIFVDCLLQKMLLNYLQLKIANMSEIEIQTFCFF